MALKIEYSSNINQSALLGDKQAQKELQKKYFHDELSCHTLVKSFFSSLKSKHPNTTIQCSSNGSTGFTFLCKVPSSAIVEETVYQPIGLVLKWQSREMGSVERIGALFYRALGLPAPVPYFIEQSLADGLGKLAAKECPKMESIYASLSLIAMPQLHANDFKGAVKNEKLKKLPVADQEVLLQRLGTIAVLDLVLGNSDRLISFMDNPHTPFEVPSRFNSGNVMIETEEREQHQRLIEVYPIDNCTTNMMDKKKVVVEEESLGEMGLFLEEEDSPPSCVSEKVLEPAVEEVPVDMEKEFQGKIERLNQVCLMLIENLDGVVEHITGNITADLRENAEKIEDYQKFIQAIPKQVKLGMLEGIKLVKTFNFALFREQFAPDESLDSFSRRALLLLEKNIGAVNKL